MQKATYSRSVIEARTARTVKTARTVAVFVFVIDRALKWYVAQMPAPYEIGVFSFGHFLNPALFFFPAWSFIPWLALLVLLAIFGLWILDLFRISDFGFRISRTALLPILLGGASNVFDRFAYSGVIDIVAIRGLGTFNLADLLIFWGLWMLFFQKHGTIKTT